MAGKKRTAPGEGYAAYANEHLAYEAKMFVFAWDLFRLETSKPPENEADVFRRNLFGEGCLIHFRNLVDFFYPSKLNATDVIAEDYAPNWEADKIPPALDALRRRVHKELVHLTTERIPRSASAGKEWKFGELRRELGKVICEFLKVADPQILSKEAGDALRRVLQAPGGVLITGAPVFNSSGS